MESTIRQRASGTAGAAFVTALGGAAAMGAAFLTWSSLGAGRIGRGLSVPGTRLPAGKVALIAGIALVLLGVGLWLIQGAEPRRWFAVASVVLAGVLVGAAVAELQSDVTALAGELRSVFRRGPLRGLVSPTTGPGVYLALTGGLVALAGGLAGVFWTTVPASIPPGASPGVDTRNGTVEAFSKGRAG
jgi:hypothetical protein